MDKALEIQKQVQEILGTDQVFLVGGSVRDIVMGKEAKDYDFTTPMLPEEMVEKVKEAGRRVYAIGQQFGTIGFKVPVDDTRWSKMDIPVKYEYVEVTTFRSEVYTNKSRKPEVKFVPSLDEDLARRDFTMNAMVLRSDGTIYDPYGGRLHIHSKKIQTVGLPKDRIQEDPLRMLRAARFAARYGFTIDPNFIGKARHLADRIFDVSVERWVQELDKLITSKDARGGLEALHEMGVLPRILPELYGTNSRSNPFNPYSNPYTEADKAWKYLLDNIVIPDIIKEGSRTTNYINTGICSRLKFSNDRSKFILDKSKKKD